MKINYKFSSIKFIAIFSLGSLGIIAFLKPAWATPTNQSDFTGFVNFHFNDLSIPVYTIDPETGEKSPTVVGGGKSRSQDVHGKTLGEVKAAVQNLIAKLSALGAVIEGSGFGPSSLIPLSQSLIASKELNNLVSSSSLSPSINVQKLTDAIDNVSKNTEEFSQLITPLFSLEGLQLDQINPINFSVKRTKESLLVLLEELNSIPANQPDKFLIAKKEMLNSINDLTSILSDVSEITKAYNKAISESE